MGCADIFSRRYQATVVDAHESRYFPLVPKLGGFGTHLPGGKLCFRGGRLVQRLRPPATKRSFRRAGCITKPPLRNEGG